MKNLPPQKTDTWCHRLSRMTRPEPFGFLYILYVQIASLKGIGPSSVRGLSRPRRFLKLYNDTCFYSNNSPITDGMAPQRRNRGNWRSRVWRAGGMKLSQSGSRWLSFSPQTSFSPSVPHSSLHHFSLSLSLFHLRQLQGRWLLGLELSQTKQQKTELWSTK